MSNPSSWKKTMNDEDQVEQLLRAAQDDMLLKLSLNSHIAHSSAAIDPDLDRRFLALKKPKQPSTTASNYNINKIDTDHVAAEGGDDLFARFTALKSSLPSHSRSNLSNDEGCSIDKQISLKEDGNNTEEDEVEKVIKWAIDAARLDPSSPSDDYVDEDESDDDDDDESDDDERVQNRKKGKKK